MNIKAKLIEQLSILENLQSKAMESEQLNLAFNISNGILQYIKEIDAINDNDYTCPDCEEALAKETEAQEIADVCSLPIELVKRVLAGQDVVLNA